MIGVTGATGTVGGAVLDHLRQLLPGEELVAIGRHLSRLTSTPGLHRATADYEHSHDLRRAFQDVSTLVFVASDGEPQLMERHHANVLDAIDTTGVERVIYTSITAAATDSRFPYAEIHRRTEQHLLGLEAEVVIVRMSMFAEFFLDRWASDAVATGVLALPAGNGVVSFVSRGDVAEGVARLAAKWPGDSLRTFTGPESHPLDGVAEVLSRHTRRPVRYQPVEETTYRADLTLERDWLVHAFATMWREVAAGSFATVNRELPELLGRPTRTFAAAAATQLAP